MSAQKPIMTSMEIVTYSHQIGSAPVLLNLHLAGSIEELKFRQKNRSIKGQKEGEYMSGKIT